MNGQCGDEFKPYNSQCENCDGYEHCMKLYRDLIENSIIEEKDKVPGDNYPVLRGYENDIKRNKEKFSNYTPIKESDIRCFRQLLDEFTTDSFYKALEIFKEDSNDNTI